MVFFFFTFFSFIYLSIISDGFMIRNINKFLLLFQYIRNMILFFPFIAFAHSWKTLFYLLKFATYILVPMVVLTLKARMFRFSSYSCLTFIVLPWLIFSCACFTTANIKYFGSLIRRVTVKVCFFVFVFRFLIFLQVFVMLWVLLSKDPFMIIWSLATHSILWKIFLLG